MISNIFLKSGPVSSLEGSLAFEGLNPAMSGDLDSEQFPVLPSLHSWAQTTSKGTFGEPMG